MTLEGFELLSVLETDDVVGGDRFLQRHGRLERLGGSFAASARYPCEGAMDLVDQRRKILGRYGVVADISRDNRRRQLDECST